jgi:hypothetical protein
VDEALSAAVLRWLRAVDVLERIGTRAAADLLEQASRAGRGDWLAREADAARGRLSRGKAP